MRQTAPKSPQSKAKTLATGLQTGPVADRLGQGVGELFFDPCGRQWVVQETLSLSPCRVVRVRQTGAGAWHQSMLLSELELHRLTDFSSVAAARQSAAASAGPVR